MLREMRGVGSGQMCGLYQIFCATWLQRDAMEFVIWSYLRGLVAFINSNIITWAKHLHGVSYLEQFRDGWEHFGITDIDTVVSVRLLLVADVAQKKDGGQQGEDSVQKDIYDSKDSTINEEVCLRWQVDKNPYFYIAKWYNDEI